MPIRPVHVSDADLDAAELARLRRRSGLSVEDLATAIDMDAGYVRDMEEGAFPITRPAALAIRYVLDRV